MDNEIENVLERSSLQTQKAFALHLTRACYLAITILLLFGVVVLPPSKHLTLRFLIYLPCAFAIPFLARKQKTYPYLADYAILSLLYLDTLSNGLHIYDALTGYDKLIHFIGPMFVLVAIYQLARPLQTLPIFWRFLCLTALGTLGGVFWEGYEFLNYLTDGAPALKLKYADTMVDLIFDLSGSALLAWVITRERVQRFFIRHDAS